MRKKTRKPPRPIIEPQRWARESALARVHHFNERCLMLVAEQAIEEEPLAALWRQMDPRAFTRAAGCPVLLMELHFHRLDKWQRMTQRVKGPSVAQAKPSPADERITTLLREILLEAWTLGRTMPRALNLLFGMTSQVSAVIGQLAAPDIDYIAAGRSQRHMRLRWPESRTFWKGLLEAAIGTNDRALKLVHLHCLQLLGSETIPALD